MELKEIQALIKFVKKQGILKFKSGDLEIELSPDSIIRKRTKRELKEKPSELKPQYSEDQILMWSVPDLDPLKERVG